jgi:apolipoprotein N-acyltransferase
VVDPYGRVVAESGIFEQASMVEDVRFLTIRTIYSRIGDVIAYIAVAIVALALLVLRRT